MTQAWLQNETSYINAVFVLIHNHNFFSDLNHSNITSSSAVLCPNQGVDGSLLVPAPSGDSPYWGLHSTVPIYVAFIIFPLLNFRDVSFFTKFNSLGEKHESEKVISAINQLLVI